MQGTIEQLETQLELGYITWYNTADFVDFGNVQTVYAGQAKSYKLDKTVNLYAIIGVTLDPSSKREYIALEQVNKLFR